MKKYYSVYMVILLSIAIAGCNTSKQVASISDNNTLSNSPAIQQEDPLFVSEVDVPPTFQGKEIKEFEKFIFRKMQYPKGAMQQGIQGTVIVGFVIEKDGSVSNVKILQGAHYLLNEEAVRTIKSSPKWEPAQHNGEPVRVVHSFPVIFMLRTF